MKTTKLGVSVGLLGAGAYLATYFSGYFVAFLIAGYVLMFEENVWLKKACVKAIAVSCVFDVLTAAIGLIPDVLSWISSFLGIFGVYFSYSLASSIISVVVGAIGIVQTVVFLALGLKALKQDTIAIPVVDGMIEKYIA